MKTFLGAIVAIVVIGAGIWFWKGSKPKVVGELVEQGQVPSGEMPAQASEQSPAGNTASSPEAKPSTPAKPMTEDEFKEKLQSQLETAVKDGLDSEDAAAQTQFLNGIVAGFKLDDDQRRQVVDIQQAMIGELARAANDAQKDRIYQEYAEKLGQVLGAGGR